jgi:hypothetical protein
MHVQAQVDRNGRAIGGELLMRWPQADGAMVPPSVFIPVAEDCGLIVAWALGAAPGLRGGAATAGGRTGDAAVGQRQPDPVPPGRLCRAGAAGAGETARRRACWCWK